MQDGSNALFIFTYDKQNKETKKMKLFNANEKWNKKTINFSEK